jgi:hypothetical protein
MLKQPIQGIAVSEVGLMKIDDSPGYRLDSADGFNLAVAEIVDDNHIEAVVEQFYASVAADVTGSARNQNSGFHDSFPL